ncbi:DUF4097 family beta strand repeat-containing protein [Anaerorhabdus sp.]|uniref:DUF4097 family beta strand repeat-containing protein n=1 Tax=Anaerorhabdus sp. TaxID=1872524 RepID=UPI002FCC212B
MKIKERYTDVKKIKVKLVEEDIVVNYHDDNDIYVQYDGDFNNKVSFEMNNNELVIERKFSIEQLVCMKISKGILQLFLPKTYNIDLKLFSTSGHIQIYTNNDDIDLQTVSGRIESHGIGNYADIETVSGSIRVYQPYTKIYFKTTSGSVKLAAKEDSYYKGSTVSAGVLISLLENQGYKMSFKSISGRFNDKYALKKGSNNIEYTEGKQRAVFLINTVSGNCKLDNWL